ncbi:hypothetical protein [Kibdelosporangium phytohabitans]|uniref:Polymorphic outer membrane protein n=1 Tax=Kibdelosporangium phytohabitans TaxID=860235 RepID=A0A0N9I4S7_9PSEU|nr:hypothetical protein [Kibdelosporangium phytohabitans]ALG15045.1 hypothetical protein AOZ06_24990 [Kibdelosporangium phytohabitans]MBE1468915.1 hypothetical protein [Kibdelosporangium phytohabitans]
MTVLAAFALAAPAAHAGTIDVPCDPDALIEAVHTANASYFEPDTLSLAANCVYTLTEPVPGRWAAGLPAIEDTLTIDGNNATIRRLPDAPRFRIITNRRDLTLNNITITGGHVPDATGTDSSGGGNFGEDGGGIDTWGPLTVNNSTITGNAAGAGAPGADATATTSAGWGGQGGWGGGIFAYAVRTVTINNSSITNNATGIGGRGGNGAGTKPGARSGSSGAGGGVAILRDATLRITGSDISGNVTADGPQGSNGGVDKGAAGDGGSGGAGAGVYVSATEGRPMNSTITASTIAGNRAGRGGDRGVPGPGAPYLARGGIGGIGGGILVLTETLTVDGGRITDNTAGEFGPGYAGPALGGGVYNIDGQVTLTNAAELAGNHPDDCYPVTGCTGPQAASRTQHDSGTNARTGQLHDIVEKQSTKRTGG